MIKVRCGVKNVKPMVQEQEQVDGGPEQSGQSCCLESAFICLDVVAEWITWPPHTQTHRPPAQGSKGRDISSKCTILWPLQNAQALELNFGNWGAEEKWGFFHRVRQKLSRKPCLW